jgi:phosphatidylserine/phosphatidylglycerophosphate/cardiolipin synthase-like enzyme
VDQSLRELDAALLRGRDLLPFDLETDASIRRLLDLLRSGKIEVRRYTRQFLHAKAFLFRTPGGGLVTGSSNLTYAGLRKNVELNLGHFDTPAVPRVEAWFDELWADAEAFDLAAIYDRLMAEFPPYLIYLRVLYALYGEELAQEQQERGEIPLTTFQEHGVWRALRILQKCGGVLVADGVGLGKTFLAGAIIGQYRGRR